MPSPLLSLAAFAARVIPDRWRSSLYRLGPLSRLIRSTLNRAAPGTPSEVRVAAGDLKGVKLVLDLKSEKPLWLGTYEPQLQAAIRTFAGPSMTVYDVGANLGYTSLLLARAVGPTGKVFAFEPDPRNLNRLAGHVAANPEGARIAIVPAAAGARGGRARLRLHRSTSMGKLEGAVGRDSGYLRSTSVRLVSIDGFAAGRSRPPHLVKIDVEGAEGMVLSGMQRTLDRARPAVLLELHGPEAARQAWRTLQDHGYAVFHMRRGYPPVRDPRSLAWKAYVVALPMARRRRR
ncbi:MAG TPA: FkbM family methyltransferase [Anaerolineales bacterium]